MRGKRKNHSRDNANLQLVMDNTVAEVDNRNAET